MIHLIALLLVASISPQEALKRSHAASKREAKEICERIEKELGERFDGGEFSTTFDAKLPFTASYVRGHFEDHWRIEWNNWDPQRDPYFWQMDKHEPKSVFVEETFGWLSRRVRALRWKMDLKPKPEKSRPKATRKHEELPNGLHEEDLEPNGWSMGSM